MRASSCSSGNRFNSSRNLIISFLALGLMVAELIQCRDIPKTTTPSNNDTVSTKPEKILRLTRFNHQSCNDSVEYLLQIDDVSISSNMTSQTNEILVNFTGELTTDLSSPIEMDVRASMRVGRFWVPFPCIHHFGACHYDDVCALTTECPQQDEDGAYSCQCPIKKGKMSVSNLSAQLPSKVRSGYFIIVANATQGNDTVLCQEIFVKFQWFTVDEGGDGDGDGDGADGGGDEGGDDGDADNI